MATDLEVVPLATRQASALRLLARAYQKPRIQALVRNIAKQYYELEAANVSALKSRRLGDSTGRALDLIGEVLVEPRKGRNDAAYTVALRIVVAVRKSRGRTQDIHEILTLTGYPYVVRDYPPAAFRVEVFGAASYEVAPWVFAAKGGGIAVEVVYSPVAASETFAVSSRYGGTTAASQVWSSRYQPAIGTPLASARRI